MSFTSSEGKWIFRYPTYFSTWCIHCVISDRQEWFNQSIPYLLYMLHYHPHRLRLTCTHCNLYHALIVLCYSHQYIWPQGLYPAYSPRSQPHNAKLLEQRLSSSLFHVVSDPPLSPLQLFMHNCISIQGNTDRAQKHTIECTILRCYIDQCWIVIC